MKQQLSIKWDCGVRDSLAILFRWAQFFSSNYRSFATSGLRKTGLAAASTATLALSACVESQTPLIADTQPLIGQQFEVHLYENFVDGKANDFHSSVYRWKDDQYVRGNGLARDAKRFVAKSLAANDFLIQSTDENGKLYNYWIGRKLAAGVYLIFPLSETDADEATRSAICGKDQPEGICRVQSYDQLVTLARATAAKPVREAALGVILTK